MKKGVLGLSLVVGLLGISACGNDKPDAQQQTVATTSQSVAESSSEVAAPQSTTKESTSEADGAVGVHSSGDLTFEETLKLFQDRHKGVAITEIEWEKTGAATSRYKIQGEDNQKEYEMKIDNLGNVQSDIDHEDDDDNDWQEDQLDLQKVISLEEVFDVIEKQQANAEVTEADLKKDDGLTKWEVKGLVKDGNLSAEVEWTLNGETGQLLARETDDDTDDRDDDTDDDDD